MIPTPSARHGESGLWRNDQLRPVFVALSTRPFWRRAAVFAGSGNRRPELKICFALARTTCTFLVHLKIQLQLLLLSENDNAGCWSKFDNSSPDGINLFVRFPRSDFRT